MYNDGMKKNCRRTNHTKLNSKSEQKKDKGKKNPFKQHNHSKCSNSYPQFLKCNLIC